MPIVVAEVIALEADDKETPPQFTVTLRCASADDARALGEYLYRKVLVTPYVPQGPRKPPRSPVIPPPPTPIIDF